MVSKTPVPPDIRIFKVAEYLNQMLDGHWLTERNRRVDNINCLYTDPQSDSEILSDESKQALKYLQDYLNDNVVQDTHGAWNVKKLASDSEETSNTYSIWLDEAGINWVDKHLCLASKWRKDDTRLQSGKMCNRNLDNENCELVFFSIASSSPVDETDDTLRWNGNVQSKDIFILMFAEFYQSLCWGGFEHTVMRDVYDYTTVTYADFCPDKVNNKTNKNKNKGTLKVFAASDTFGYNSCSQNTLAYVRRLAHWPTNQLPPPDTYSLTMMLLETILNPVPNEETGGLDYPILWKRSVETLAKAEITDTTGMQALVPSGLTWADAHDTVKEMFACLANALPFLMASRWHYDVFGQFRNGNIPLTDYEQESNVVALSIPIVDVTSIKDTIADALAQVNIGDNGFSYNGCIIDLLPATERDEDGTLIYSDYKDCPTDKFPMRLVGGISPNGDASYKTTKIVLTRMESISGDYRKDQDDEDGTAFTMGSRDTYYSKITDANRLKYKASEAIVQKSIEDAVDVRLTNGGAYQKNGTPHDFPNTAEVKDNKQDATFYSLTDGEKKDKNGDTVMDENGNPIYQKKYRKNKHFFIDPFALTIAQWCYIHGWADKGTARTELAKSKADGGISNAGFSEMERSYWRYLYVWETSEWNQLISKKSNDDFTWSTMDFDDARNRLIGEKEYNPLEDTRPYYYATYRDVRGTPQVYKEVEGDWTEKYQLTPGIGDEFQMNTRTVTESFMDILNTKVAFRTGTRLYKPDNHGARVIDDNALLALLEDDEFKQNVGIQQDDDTEQKLKRVKKYKQWQTGECGGMNFDLPTEAQWEYCCRYDNQSGAYPGMMSIGDNFEEREPHLDLIAWYKYKVIGSAPEPERFCAWRASKFLFGISKDLEQVNNVYETTD